MKMKLNVFKRIMSLLLAFVLIAQLVPQRITICAEENSIPVETDENDIVLTEETEETIEEIIETEEIEETSEIEKAEEIVEEVLEENEVELEATDVEEMIMFAALEPEPKKEYEVYHYALIPGVKYDKKNPDQAWFGIGITTVTDVEDPALLDTGTVVDSFTIGREIKPMYPDLSYGGKKYKYAEPGSENENKEGYYTLKFYRLVVSSGANKGNNSYFTPVPTKTHTYHIDYTCVLNEKSYYSVTYSIKDSGSSSYQTLTKYSSRVESGAKESVVQIDPLEDKDGYVFVGWYKDPECTVPAKFDGTITANTNYYGQYLSLNKISWLNEDGTLLELDENVRYGTLPEYNGDTPVKEEDSRYTYTFKGWSPEVVAVTEDAEYTAVYEALPKKYNVNYKITGEYMAGDYKSVEFAYGEELTPLSDDMTVKGYTFSGWSGIPETMPDHDVEVTGYYTINTYTVTWINYDGTALKTDTVEYGKTPVYEGDTPVKEATPKATYTFNGWSPEIVPVTDDAEYTAQFEETLIEYTVTYDLNGGNSTSSKLVFKVHYGDETPAIAIPTRSGYTFAGWDKQISDVVLEDVTYTAKWKAIPVPPTPDPEPPLPPRPTPTPAPAPDPVPEVEPEPSPVEPVPVTPEAEIIDDDPTPKAEIERTWAIANLVLSIATAAMAVVTLFAKKRSDDDEEEDKKYERRSWPKYAGIGVALLGALVFILTEDMSQIPVIYDKWTIAHIALTLGGILTTYLGFKKHEPEEEEKAIEA